MRDEPSTDPLSIYNRREPEKPDESGFDSPDDEQLRALFTRWSVPRAPASLDARITQSYRQQVSSKNSQEVFMKQCPTCQEEFAPKFSFCPVDGTPLNEATTANVEPATPNIAPVNLGAAMAAALVPAGAEFHLTFVDDTGLTRRLMDELKVVAHSSELTWPEFKRDPFGYTKRFIVGYSTLIWRFFSSKNVAIATSTALFVVLTFIILFVVVGKYQYKKQIAQADSDLTVEQLINTDDIPPEEEKTKPDEGIGTGQGGRVGFNKGKGEGSKPKFEKAGGGGGGGQEEVLPPQQGKIRIVVGLAAVAAGGTVVGVTLATRTDVQRQSSKAPPFAADPTARPEVAQQVREALKAWPAGTARRLRILAARYPQSALVRLELGLALALSGQQADAASAWQD